MEEDSPHADMENTAELYFALFTALSHLSPSILEAVMKQTQHLLGKDVYLSDVKRIIATNSVDLIKALCGLDYASQYEKSSTGHVGDGRPPSGKTADPIFENYKDEEQKIVAPVEEKMVGASFEHEESSVVETEVQGGEEIQEVKETVAPLGELNGAATSIEPCEFPVEEKEERGDQMVKKEPESQEELPVMEVAEQNDEEHIQEEEREGAKEEFQEENDGESCVSALNRTFDVEVSSLAPEDVVNVLEQDIATEENEQPLGRQQIDEDETVTVSPSEKAPKAAAHENIFAVVGDHPGVWDPSLSDDDLHYVTISLATDPSDFHVALHFENGKNPTINALSDWMNNYKGRAEDLPVKVEDVVPGLPVAVLDEDDIMERGVIVNNVPLNNSISVLMIDKAVTKTTPIYNMFRIPKILMTPDFPVQAIHCTVGVYPGKFKEGKPLWPKQCMHSLERAVRTETVYLALFGGEQQGKTIVNLYTARHGYEEKKSFLYHVTKYLAISDRKCGMLSPTGSMISLFGDSQASQSDMESTLDTTYDENNDSDKTLEDEAPPSTVT